MNKQPEITEATRQRFVEAFLALYKEKSIEKITVREITDRAGYNRITFYRYFESIYDLHDYIVRMMFTRLRPRILENVFKSGDPSVFASQITALQKEWGETLSVMLRPGFYERLPEEIRTDLLEQLCSAFELDRESVPVSYILDYYMNSIFTLLHRRLNDPEELSEEEFAELLWGILHEGVLRQLNNYR